MYLKEDMKEVNEVSDAPQDDHCSCHRPIYKYALIILGKDSAIQERHGILFFHIYLYIQGYGKNAVNECCQFSST